MTKSRTYLNKQYAHLRNLTDCLSRGQLDALNKELIEVNKKYPTMRFTLKRKQKQVCLIVSYKEYPSFNINVVIPFDNINDARTLKYQLLRYVDDDHIVNYILMLDMLMKRQETFVEYYRIKHQIDQYESALKFIAESCDTDIIANFEDDFVEDYQQQDGQEEFE